MKFYRVGDLIDDDANCCLCGNNITMRETGEEYITHFINNHGLSRFVNRNWRKQTFAHGTFVKITQKQRVLR